MYIAKVEEQFALIKAERGRQDAKWGLQGHGIYQWLSILGEEIGEIHKAALEHDVDNLKVELIQAAAVLVAIAQDLAERDDQVISYYEPRKRLQLDKPVGS